MHVTYVFGPRLPAHGRCPATATELARLCRRTDEVACYVVEVCPECAWNHLARTYPAGGRYRAAARAARPAQRLSNGSGIRFVTTASWRAHLSRHMRQHWQVRLSWATARGY